MKIKHLMVGLLALAAAVACKQDEPVETPSLEVSQETLALAATEAEASFNVTANVAWTATADQDWVSLDPASGDASKNAATVTVTAENNTAKEARTATVTVKAGDLTKTVALTQAAATDEPGDNPTPGLPDSEWALVGNFNDWDPSVETYLSVLDEEYFVYYACELPENAEFKFLKGGAWPPAGQEVGGNGLAEPNTIQTAGGSNIKVAAAGTYDIYLAADLSKFYIMEAGKLPSEATDPAPVALDWGLMGTFVDNNWVNDIPMTAEGEWVVAKGVQFASTIEFKIRAGQSWVDATSIGVVPGSTYGLVNGKIDVVTGEYSKTNHDGADAENIVVSASLATDKTYDVYFSYENLEVYVMEVGSTPGSKEILPPTGAPIAELYMLGEACKAGWSLSDMEAFTNNDGVFTWTGALKANKRFRFNLVKDSANQSWWPALCLTEDGTSVFYATADPDTNYLLAEDGTYTVTVDVRDWNNSTVSIEKVGDYPYSFTVAGSLNGGWNTSAENALMTLENGVYVARNVPMKWASNIWAGEPECMNFRIVETGQWIDQGYTAAVAEVSDGSSPVDVVWAGDAGHHIGISLPEGNYDVYFDLANLKVWLEFVGVTAKSYTVAGSLNGGWATAAENALMTLENGVYVARNVPMQWASNTWSGEPEYMTFRIVETGQWIDKGYTAAVAGVSDGSAPVDVVWAGTAGHHIAINLPEGKYDVYFDETNLKVWLEPVVPAHTYTVAGSFNGGWNTSAENAAMTLENGVYVAKNVPLQWGSSTWDGQPSQIIIRITKTGEWIDPAYCGASEAVYDGKTPVDVVWGGPSHLLFDVPEGNYNVYFDETNLKVWLEPVAPACVYTVAGSFNGGWNTTAANAGMVLENGVYVAKNVPLKWGSSTWDGQPSYVIIRIAKTGEWIDPAYCGAAEAVYDGTAPVDVVWGGPSHLFFDVPEGNYNVYFDETNLKVWIGHKV